MSAVSPLSQIRGGAGHEHDNESWLDARLEHSEKKPDNHQGSKILCRSRAGNDDAPAKDVGGQVLCNGKLLQEQIGRILSDENPHVQNSAEPTEFTRN